jgi:hypothetical protein
MAETKSERVRAVKKILVPLFALIASVTVSYADSWPWPTEKDYFSANGRFVAHVTPPKYLQKDEPLLEVFEIRATERVPFWQHKMGNLKAPVEVYVSNDGECVVSINEHGRVGYGDYVLAFYGKDGRIKNYSMEQVLHLPKDISPLELVRLIPHSVSSRWWDRNSIKFFDTYLGKLYFCIWLHLFDRWIAWDPTSGEELGVSDEMIEKWNNKARLWSIKEIEKPYPGDTGYEFLAKLKKPDDRPLIEKLLLDEQFSVRGTHSRTVRPPSTDGGPVYHLERYYCSSARRLLAERLLASRDGRPTDKRVSSTQPLYHLGKIEGVVTLPKTDDANKATLWIYLVPSTVPKDQWHREPPVQRLAVSFSDYSFRNFDLEHTQKFPFGIAGVTPGEYWIKAVLDKTKPFSKPADKFYVPDVGDYESIESPMISIQAGETIENLSIDCTHQVADGTD